MSSPSITMKESMYLILRSSLDSLDDSTRGDSETVGSPTAGIYVQPDKIVRTCTNCSFRFRIGVIQPNAVFCSKGLRNQHTCIYYLPKVLYNNVLLQCPDCQTSFLINHNYSITKSPTSKSKHDTQRKKKSNQQLVFEFQCEIERKDAGLAVCVNQTPKCDNN
jgi:hypothetical protein